MKNYFIISIVAGALFFSSCEKFLNVLPKTEVPEDKQFTSEQGFKDALAGIYIAAKRSDAYGRELSFGTIENLISSWDVVSNSKEQRIGLFNFTDQEVVQKFNSIFSAQYYTIAHINALLKNLETNRAVLTSNGMYEVIKGECLGMRALIHLDLIRLYGPQPGAPAQGNQLAYVTTFDRELNNHIPFEAFMDHVLSDLKEAAMLIKPFDPLLNYSMADVREPNGFNSKYRPQNDFLSFRNMRMNYYAIKAVEARASLWIGDKQGAYLAAKEVVEAKNADGSLKFKLGSATDYSAGNYSLTTEQIFGLYAFDMSKTYTKEFASGLLKKGTAATTITNQLFGNTGTDLREATLWNLLTLSNGSRAYTIKKFLVNPDKVTLSTDYKQIPLIRSSEIYLILAETAPFAEGVNYFKTFRAARNIDKLGTPQDYPGLMVEVLKEYRKEFYAEGQAFYSYKRLNARKDQILFVPAAAVINYLLPMPTVETIN